MGGDWSVLDELAVIFHIFVPKSAGAPPSKWLHIKWFPKDSPFYRNYIIATSAEWAMMLVMQAFFLSLVVELRYAYAHPPRVSFRRKPDEDEGLRGWIDVQRDVGVVHVPATQSSTQKVVGNPHQASVVGSASAGKAVVRPAQENRGHMEILDPRTPHSGPECRYCDELLKRGSKKIFPRRTQTNFFLKTELFGCCSRLFAEQGEKILMIFPEETFGKVRMHSMVLSHGWLAPVAAVCCTLTAAFSGYIIGVTEGHFNAVLPFISTAGCFLPEASIFAQFLNMASFFMIIMFYMRHRQTVEYYGHRLEWEESGWRKMSLVLMGIGIMSAVGLTIVANFRVCEMGLVHAIGALMTFFAILVYCWGQVILSYALVPRMASMPVNHFRFVVVTLATCFLILHARTSVRITKRSSLDQVAGD
ncbi:hypothetical protein RB195_002207 [Necator americanus]|uniref:CWH43-like N-terminal domain-containing protein n=1 Tax=Necator americanus TaxID=51031 RepID=A0ABR1DJC5_NECAM